MLVSFDHMGHNEAIFFSPGGTVNEQMKITYDNEDSLSIVPQEDYVSIDISFFYSLTPVRDSSVLIDHHATSSRMQVIKVR